MSTDLSIHSQIKINKESGLVLPERDRHFSERANFGDKLIENLDKRYTIDVLSSGFLMNQTTLKAVFKKVYGKPIASCMKDYRMKKLPKFLRKATCCFLTSQGRSDTPAKASSARRLKNRTESFRAAVVKNKCLPVLSDNRIIEFERTCFEYEKSY